MNIFIIIPVYNEAKVIDALSNLKKFPHYKVVIVDDASTDNPDFKKFSFPFTLITHSINLGQGAALQTGMEYALSKNADVVVHFDADGQHDYNEIENIIYPIKMGFSDVVIGSRFLNKKNNSSLKIPFVKFIVLKIARYVQYVFTGKLLSDSQNGFRAFSNKAASLIRISENRMAHAIEIIQLIKKNKLSLIEVPVIISYTEYSIQKGQKIVNGLFIILCLFRKAISERLVVVTVLIFILSLIVIKYLLRNIEFFDLVLLVSFFSSLFYLIIILNKKGINKKIKKTNTIRSLAIQNLQSFKSIF